MLEKTTRRHGPCSLRVTACLAALLLAAATAQAQGFVGVSYGYNFAGDAGCRSATDCQNKNWNWGGSLGSLGSLVGFEAEFTHEGEFTGDRVNPTSVTTLMGDFMLGPRITIVQPYGLIGIGAIKTTADAGLGSSESETQAGWSIGGGVLVYVQKHIGLRGDVRYYHSFQTLNLLGIDLARDQNKIDFGRAGFGVILKF
ncbi:MAG TPA: outer membrane beta-barrel protein [Vicinamibacterales bacterium]|jgi:opacity protein-like surface antigen